MKIDLDSHDIAALADIIAERLVPAVLEAVATKLAEGAAPAPAKAEAAPKAAKPAAKPAAKAKPKEDEAETTLDQAAVHKALRDFAGPNDAPDYAAKRDKALSILRKYSDTLATLPKDKYEAVVADLKAASSAPAVDADDDPF